MDFVTVATATSTRNLLRHLVGEDEDDDFSHLSSSSSSSQSHTVASSGQESQVMDADRPLLSPAAEAELFLLATNFLLYVAMVIITTMIAKIYFPESLKRGQSQGPVSRSYSYRMVGETTENTNTVSDDESYYGSDVSDDEDDDSDEGLDSNASTTASDRRQDNLRNFMEFDQQTMSKAQVLQRLLFCSLMLNITFVTWGVLQERMLTRRYPRFTGEFFTYSYALVFTNRLWTLVMAGCLLLYLKPRQSRSTVIYEYSFPSISNMLSSWCQYEALRYVSFPAVTLFKSFKLAPVMLMGKFLGNKTYPQYDYVVALVIGCGIALFMSSTDELSFGVDVHGDKASATWTGVMLLFFFLFFDSFTSQWQSRMFQRHPDLSMVELMFATSAFSVVLSFITLVHTQELSPALSFVYRHSEIHLHFFMFSICSTIGQLFIFYTIKNFGAVVFTLIMTTRILLSIALSCILYGHQVTAMGFFGLMLVLGSVLYRIKKKAEGQQLLKWEGMEDDKAMDLVQEWHEHVDM